MASSNPNYYWDTCIFFAYLNNEVEKYAHLIDHIEQYLDECRQGLLTIYTSTVTIAEIPSNKLSSNEYGTFTDFLKDYSGAIIQVGADPNVMTLASEIKGITHLKGKDGRREVGTLDAIHLASALCLSADYGVPIQAFHTFDTGKSKTLEGGRAMPLLGYETWCVGMETDPVASRIIALNRCKPEHLNPRLPLPNPVEAKPPEAPAAPQPPSGPPVENGKPDTPPTASNENKEPNGHQPPAVTVEAAPPTAPPPPVQEATTPKPPPG